MSKKLSFCGVFTALSILFLYICQISPTGKIALMAAASYCIGVCAIWAGIKFSAVAYMAASVLSLVLLYNKMIAILFVLFFGIYPIAKFYIENIKNIYIEWIVKLVSFNIYACGYYVAADSLFNLPQGLMFLLAVLNIGFIVYDIMFTLVVTKVLIIKRGRNL